MALFQPNITVAEFAEGPNTKLLQYILMTVMNLKVELKLTINSGKFNRYQSQYNKYNFNIYVLYD